VETPLAIKECLASGLDGVRGIVAYSKAYSRRTLGLCLEHGIGLVTVSGALLCPHLPGSLLLCAVCRLAEALMEAADAHTPDPQLQPLGDEGRGEQEQGQGPIGSSSSALSTYTSSCLACAPRTLPTTRCPVCRPL